MSDVDWSSQLAEQLDRHWREQLRPRLDGLTDAEYRWEPVPGAWNVRPRGTGTAPVAVGAGEFILPRLKAGDSSCSRPVKEASS